MRLTVLFVFNLLVVLTFAQQSQSSFIANQGQWDGPFEYKAEYGNLTVFAEGAGFTFVAREPAHNHAAHPQYGKYDALKERSHDLIKAHAFRLRFEEANSLDFSGVEKLEAYHNYMLGQDRSKWKSRVPLYKQIVSSELYEGISLRTVNESGGFKYDYILQPGSNPSMIKFRYTGLDDISLADGKLLLQTSVGEFVESIPVSYQIIDGERIEVKCAYRSMGDEVFGFEILGDYNPDSELIIDPVLVAATLSGSNGAVTNFGHGATYDITGNIYTHAISFGQGYPTSEGAFQIDFGGGGTDVAISKYNPDGSEQVYATYVGGSGGDSPFSTVVNANQEIYIYGRTSSSDFPVSIGAFQSELAGAEDIFVTGISIDGTELVGSTYLGGTGNDGFNTEVSGAGYDALRGEIYVNLFGEVYIASSSSSSDFPTTAGTLQPNKKNGQDAVVVKLNDDLSELIWSTFVGSNGGDMAYGIRVKDDQTVVIAGAVSGSESNANELETTTGAYQEEYGGGNSDGFIMNISPEGDQILECSFLGLSGSDLIYFVDIDENNDVWLYMWTGSNFPTTEGVWGTSQSQLMVHRMNQELSELEVSSYVSNTGNASGNPVAFMVDLCNGVYISAFGTNSEFVASDDAIFSSGGFYVGVFEPGMTDHIYGTFYSGNHVDGGTSRFDKQGIVYQGVCSGGGFNTTDEAWSTTQSGWDIGVFKIDFEIETVNAVASAAGQLSGCVPHTVTFENFSEGEDYIWDFGNGDQSTEYEPVYVYEEPGDYLVTLVVIDSATCNIADTIAFPFQVFPEVEFFADFDFDIDCQTGIIEIFDSSSGPEDLEYFWDFGDGTVLTDQNPTHTYDSPGEYTLTLTLESDACNQQIVEEVTVVYSPFVTADFNAGVIEFCDEFLVGIADNSTNGEEYVWDMGDGTILTDPGDFEYNYESSGIYEIQLVVSNETTCDGIDTLVVTVEIPEPPVLSPELSLQQIGECEDLTVAGLLNPNGPLGEISWQVDGEEVGTDPELEYQVGVEGSYSFVVTLTDAVCEEEYIVAQDFTILENLGYTLPPSPFLCYYDDDLVLDATVPYEDAQYSWNGGLSQEPVLVVSEEGDYTVEVSFNGCVDRQTSEVGFGQEVFLAFEENICAGQDNVVVFPENEFIETITWEDGQTGTSVNVTEPGYHPFVAVDLLGCDQIDSLFAIPFDDDPNVEVPNVITPNGDGLNDVWQVSGDSLVFYDMTVFNRWGREVFKTQEIYAPWDGTNQQGSGEPLNDDTFMYVLRFRDRCARQDFVLTGDLKLLR
jgi:gliding motility-associated-like protein